MKIGVCGSRSITDRDEVYRHLDMFTNRDSGGVFDNITILSGGAKGVDQLAKDWADLNLFDHVLFKPYHMVDTDAEYKVRYFFARNKQILDNADQVLILWDGKSNGTKWCIDYLRKWRKSSDYTIITMETTDNGNGKEEEGRSGRSEGQAPPGQEA